jgi:phenylacetate-CoA ligase
MHGLALIYILRDLPQVRAFKIIQESLDLTRVLVVLEADLNNDLQSKIIQGFQARLGAGVEIQVEQVTEIPAEKSGKFRYVVSKIS